MGLQATESTAFAAGTSETASIEGFWFRFADTWAQRTCLLWYDPVLLEVDDACPTMHMLDNLLREIGPVWSCTNNDYFEVELKFAKRGAL